MMNRNVKIAKQLVRLAKSLVAARYDFGSLRSDDNRIEFKNPTDSGIGFRIDVLGNYEVNPKQRDEFKKKGLDTKNFYDFFVEGEVSVSEENDGGAKYTISVTDHTDSLVNENLYDEYSRPEYGMMDWDGLNPAAVGDFDKDWDGDVSKKFSGEDGSEKISGWIMKNLKLVADLAEKCANELAAEDLYQNNLEFSRANDSDLEFEDELEFEDD